MSTNVGLYHRTTYSFDKEVEIHPHLIRLRPAPHSRTPILSYSLSVSPDTHFFNWQQDPFGNYIARLVFPEKAKKLEIVVDLVADLTAINPFDFFLEETAETYPFGYDKTEKNELGLYLKQTDSTPELVEMANQIREMGEMQTIDFMVEANRRINQRVGYQLRMEPGVQTVAETLKIGSGSCRDSAFLLCQLFRELGVASRFVSGYLIQLTADEKPLEGAEGPKEDFTDLHAWCEVYVPGAGWIGLDPTSGLLASEGHIPLSCTPEPASAAPVVGATGICETEFSFENVITRVHEDPRVTKPYTDAQWDTIYKLGEKVDRRLDEGDARLTMGGEPTFVSIDDMEGDEWNSTADSPAKRERAIDLSHRLRDAFAQGGLIWVGEGKWYPGEPVPRWAYGIFWRKDGYPMWRSASNLADPTKKGNSNIEDAEKLIGKIAETLGFSPEVSSPAFEDIEYYKWKSSTLPVGMDDPATSDSLELKTLATLEERGLDVPTGYVLPLFVREDSKGWTSAKWEMKRDRVYLIPGASAMGFRLPLDSIREATEEDRVEERSPMDTDWEPLAANPLSEVHSYVSDNGWIPRTALSVEVREGRLHVFFPPVGKFEHYLQLLAAIEESAVNLDLKVAIEGYEPPADPRGESLKVTPDPGVIEVNVHPAKSWAELVKNTETLYEAAKQSRLGAEKFMIDGRHTGTGGGNHVVMGGQTPADSPFLRRPDVLASLITYWQHHPGLSYLFSGLFIGPTSQAPRVDEGRNDRLYELDIALDTLHEGVSHPGMIDRALRHLLTDLTGNTHRAEICIDKLMSPDSARGQLGLLELRAFEMPPHRHMALVQSLLVRSLIAMFWKEPFRQRLVRWGTTLHDKYLLPHHVSNDITDVCNDLKAAGIPFDPEWFEPFVEFRFPRFGTVFHQGMELEIRSALEPWNVLGEEATSSGTSRYVDSSVERLQLKIKHFQPERYILTCNQRPIPMARGNVAQEWVGGVRFKAWNPPSSLHPFVEAQPKLVFDIVDRHNRKSVGGCIYYVGHPGGRSYEVFPVNAREAEARRLTRFWQEGHTAGPIHTIQSFDSEASESEFSAHEGGDTVSVIVVEFPGSEFPNTLDLRSRPGKPS